MRSPRPRGTTRSQSGACRERVGRVGRHVRAYLKDDLRVAGGRYRRWRAWPALAVNEYGDAGSRWGGERGQPGRRERLAPRAEQGPEGKARAGADEHEAGRVEGDQRAVAAGAGDP